LEFKTDRVFGYYDLGRNAPIPPIDMHRVLVVASKIEETGRVLKKAKESEEE
jgi:hypothetical protein